MKDLEALNALKKDQQKGLDFFFNLYFEPICFFTQRMVGDVLVAKEITSDVFIKLWNKRDDLQGGRSIKALLYQMAHNAAIDHLRKRKRMAVHQKGLHYFYPEPNATIVQTIAETETIEQIIRTLKHLPPKCSRIFKMAYLHGKTDKEIAAELNLSPHTVRNQKERAIRLLKKGDRTYFSGSFSFFFVMS
jgi:RNA polymerase sigma-70 factor (family 1)